MAKKTVYQPLLKQIGVKCDIVDYEYFPGFALSQKQKCIKSLHKAAETEGISNILEVSSKSTEMIGVSLSAFNLCLNIQGKSYSVEQLFQASKVFEKGGPFLDLLDVSSREAKTDERIKTSGNIIAFRLLNNDFPIEPKTFFYDWLYTSALLQNKDLLKRVLLYNAFTDIEFNEKKSLNCQAYSLALFCSICKNTKEFADKEMISKEEFFKLCQDEYNSRWQMMNE